MSSESAKRLPKTVRFLQNRFSPEGYAGLHLTVGLFVVLICGWCFDELAEGVLRSSRIIQLDQDIAVWLHRHATSGVTLIARVISFFGSVAWLTTASFLAMVFFLRRRAWLDLFLVALTMLGGGALNIVLKQFFHRARPVLENPLVTLSSYGFPSGHTMGATLFYGLLALLAWNSLKTEWGRIGVLLVACLIVVLIALTRIYLGAHFLTDVIGAVLAGVLWLTVCWTAMETLRRRRSHYGTVRGRVGSRD